MTLDNYLPLGSLIVACISVAIATLSYFKQGSTRRLAFANFQRELKQPYLKWRDYLGTIELDPQPGLAHRSYTEVERRKIRDYWPKVTLVELELLKSVDRKLIASSWAVWEQSLVAGIAHGSILQEFCYYVRHEDKNYGLLRDEMIDIVYKLYKKANGNDLDCDEVLLERKEYTK